MGPFFDGNLKGPLNKGRRTDRKCHGYPELMHTSQVYTMGRNSPATDVWIKPLSDVGDVVCLLKGTSCFMALLDIPSPMCHVCAMLSLLFRGHLMTKLSGRGAIQDQAI